MRHDIFDIYYISWPSLSLTLSRHAIASLIFTLCYAIDDTGRLSRARPAAPGFVSSRQRATARTLHLLREQMRPRYFYFDDISRQRMRHVAGYIHDIGPLAPGYFLLAISLSGHIYILSLRREFFIISSIVSAAAFH